MKASTFKKLLEQVAILSKRQREQLLQVLRSTVGLGRFTEVIEQARPARHAALLAERRDFIDMAGHMACSATGASLAAGRSPH